MLILTRKFGETIVIGDDIEITVVRVDVDTHQVRLAIKAPREVPVHRKEIYQRIRRDAQTTQPVALPHS